MKLQPLADFPGAAAARKKITLADMPDECCGRCIFWHLANAQQPDAFSFPAAHCRCGPGQIVVVPVPIDESELAKMRLDPKMGAMIPQGSVPMRQTPIPMQIVKTADDWCGEFKARPKPATVQ